jgi:UrcA family protein
VPRCAAQQPSILVTATGVLASTIVAGSAIAQTAAAPTLPEVTVQSSRTVATTIGHTDIGIPIQNVSLSYGVSAKGLDLTTANGRQAFEKRVSDAAMDGCKHLAREYPDSTTSDTECVKTATSKAMAQVHAIEDAATKK